MKPSPGPQAAGEDAGTGLEPAMRARQDSGSEVPSLLPDPESRPSTSLAVQWWSHFRVPGGIVFRFYEASVTLFASF